MTFQTTNYLNEPHFGEVGLHLIKRHFHLPAEGGPASLAERAYLITAAFDPADLTLLKAERRTGLVHPPGPGWIEFDQFAHLYNILCRRLGGGERVHAGPWPYVIAGREVGCHASRIFPTAEAGSRNLQAVLIFSETDRDRGARLLEELQSSHPRNPLTIIKSLTVAPISAHSLADAFHEVMWPVAKGIPGAAIRHFDRPTQRETSKKAAATAALTRRQRLKSAERLRANLQAAMAKFKSSETTKAAHLSNPSH